MHLFHACNHSRRSGNVPAAWCRCLDSISWLIKPVSRPATSSTAAFRSRCISTGNLDCFFQHLKSVEERCIFGSPIRTQEMQLRDPSHIVLWQTQGWSGIRFGNRVPTCSAACRRTACILRGVGNAFADLGSINRTSYASVDRKPMSVQERGHN
jgi:hypothetical protein